jgi:signal transduction histidine kinase
MFFESTHKAKDGRIFPVETKTNFIQFNGNNYACTFVRDISERKRMEKEQAALEALNWQMQKEESLGRMAGAIAHHFNNQLMVVRGHIEMVMDEPVMGSASQDLTAALQGADKAVELSGLMLTYLGHTITQRKPSDLAEVCQHCHPILLATLPVNVTLKTDFQAPGPIVILSVDQIQQVLTNLIVNSAEALGKNTGAVELSIRTVLPADISSIHRFPVGWKPLNQAYACLTVADNGCGIAPEDIEKLFDPFFTSKFTGRGLGLPVVLGLTKAHDGAISVESEPDRGSTFRIFLPLAAGEPTS